VVGGLAPPPAEEEERREIEAQQQVIFVLESAQLEVAQVGKVGGCILASGIKSSHNLGLGTTFCCKEQRTAAASAAAASATIVTPLLL
jgi:hypothetical protein